MKYYTSEVLDLAVDLFDKLERDSCPRTITYGQVLQILVDLNVPLEIAEVIADHLPADSKRELLHEFFSHSTKSTVEEMLLQVSRCAGFEYNDFLELLDDRCRFLLLNVYRGVIFKEQVFLRYSEAEKIKVDCDHTTFRIFTLNGNDMKRVLTAMTVEDRENFLKTGVAYPKTWLLRNKRGTTTHVLGDIRLKSVGPAVNNKYAAILKRKCGYKEDSYTSLISQYRP